MFGRTPMKRDSKFECGQEREEEKTHVSMKGKDIKYEKVL